MFNATRGDPTAQQPCEVLSPDIEAAQKTSADLFEEIEGR